MTHWICDGNPKNGKIYSDLGGAHEPYKNYAPDCELCGLPKEAIILEDRKKMSKQILLFLKYNSGIIIVVTILSIVLGTVYFSGLFKEDNYLHTYEKASQSGEKALSIVRKHNSAEELEKAQKHLLLAITKLSKIPENASIYLDANAKMNNYDSLSVQIDNKLNNFELCSIDPKPDSCLF